MDMNAALKKFNETLVPTKSKKIYEQYYTAYACWCDAKGLDLLVEESACLYLQESKESKKTTTLWCQYSAIKNQLLLRHDIDANKWCKTVAFLKRAGEEETKKKAKVFTREEINSFLTSNHDSLSVRDKLAFLFGVFGALRAEELAALTFADVCKVDEKTMRVIIKSSKTDKAGKGFEFFAVSTDVANVLSLFDDYKSKVVGAEPNSRLFRRETKDGYGHTVLGKHFFYQLPKKIAGFLKLPEANSYTGHSMRRTAATWLADEGFTTLQMQKFGRWKSPTVAQGYVDDSTVAKREFAEAICQDNRAIKVQKTEKSGESRLLFANCVFNQPNFFLNSDNNVNE